MLTARQVSELIGIPVATVYDRWRDWQMPVYRIGRSLRWRERDVEAWLARQRVAV